MFAGYYRNEGIKSQLDVLSPKGDGKNQLSLSLCPENIGIYYIMQNNRIPDEKKKRENGGKTSKNGTLEIAEKSEEIVSFTENPLFTLLCRIREKHAD